LESLRKNIGSYVGFGSEDGIGNGDNARILAAERCNGHCIAIPSILLEMDKPLGKNEHVALTKDLGNESVLRVGSDEPYVEAAFKNRQDFCGPRMGVGAG